MIVWLVSPEKVGVNWLVSSKVADEAHSGGRGGDGIGAEGRVGGGTDARLTFGVGRRRPGAKRGTGARGWRSECDGCARDCCTSEILRQLGDERSGEGLASGAP